MKTGIMMLKIQLCITKIQYTEVDQKSSLKLTHFGFRTTLMKGFDPLQMLTTVF